MDTYEASLARSHNFRAMASRAALITGGSSGIGLRSPAPSGEDGYRLTISARRPDKLEAAAQELRDEGIDVEAVPANMADEEEIKRSWRRTASAAGASTCS